MAFATYCSVYNIKLLLVLEGFFLYFIPSIEEISDLSLRDNTFGHNEHPFERVLRVMKALIAFSV